VSVTWLAGVLAIVIVVAVASLIAMTVVGQPYGTINDVSNALISVVAALLAGAVLRAYGGSWLWVAVAAAGAVVAVVGSWLVISVTTGFVLSGFVSTVGFALVGAWLVAALRTTPLGLAMPEGLGTLGVVAGVAMVVGIIGLAGVVMRVDSFEATPPWLWLYAVGWLGTYVLLPAWAFLVARSGLAV
jgi:hypothetical protein